MKKISNFSLLLIGVVLGSVVTQATPYFFATGTVTSLGGDWQTAIYPAFFFFAGRVLTVLLLVQLILLAVRRVSGLAQYYTATEMGHLNWLIFCFAAAAICFNAGVLYMETTAGRFTGSGIFIVRQGSRYNDVFHLLFIELPALIFGIPKIRNSTGWTVLLCLLLSSDFFLSIAIRFFN